MKSIILHIILALAGLGLQVNAQTVPFIMFDIRPQDADHLRYLYYTNVFDSATISYEFGEVDIHSGEGIAHIGIPPSLGVGKAVRGIASQGENTNLLQYSRTKNFTLPESGSISFYGALSAFEPCDTRTGDDGSCGGRPGGWNSHIDDRTEFVVQLVRASDNLILSVLDSTGITAGTATQSARKYGNEPCRVTHSVSIPSGYSGTEVYVQVSPRRYGPTPYGIGLTPHCSWVNYTGIFDEYGVRRTVSRDSLISERFDAILTYCDSSRASTGGLPKPMNSWIFFTNGYADIFHQRYFDEHSLANGKKVLKERLNSPKKGATTDLAPDVLIQVSASPVNNGNFMTVIVESPKVLEETRITINTIRGEEIEEVWTGSIKRGGQKIAVPIINYASGTYLVTLLDKKGILATQKISVAQ